MATQVADSDTSCAETRLSLDQLDSVDGASPVDTDAACPGMSDTRAANVEVLGLGDAGTDVAASLLGKHKSMQR